MNESMRRLNMVTKLKLITLLMLISSSHAFAQDAIYNCNTKLIGNCDTLRNLMYWKRQVPKINYKKMLKRDKKVIAFLNAYHSDTLSLPGLNNILSKVNHFNYHSFQRNDTINYSGTIFEKGLVRIYFRYSYVEGDTHFIKRFYDLQINNEGMGFDTPLDYHYKIFRL